MLKEIIKLRTKLKKKNKPNQIQRSKNLFKSLIKCKIRMLLKQMKWKRLTFSDKKRIETIKMNNKTHQNWTNTFKKNKDILIAANFQSYLKTLSLKKRKYTNKLQTISTNTNNKNQMKIFLRNLYKRRLILLTW